tara:strand:+ start:1209 stop:1427 length:219 start_codon:yes stop_codon:yes gene_type:complete
MLMFLYYNVGDYVRYGYYNTVYVLTDIINECFDEINKYEKYEDALNEVYNEVYNEGYNEGLRENKDLDWEKV